MHRRKQLTRVDCVKCLGGNRVAHQHDRLCALYRDLQGKLVVLNARLGVYDFYLHRINAFILGDSFKYTDGLLPVYQNEAYCFR